MKVTINQIGDYLKKRLTKLKLTFSPQLVHFMDESEFDRIFEDDRFKNKELKCDICGNVIEKESVSSIMINKNKVYIICQNVGCIEKVKL
jgi:predicted peptidase